MLHFSFNCYTCLYNSLVVHYEQYHLSQLKDDLAEGTNVIAAVIDSRKVNDVHLLNLRAKVVQKWDSSALGLSSARRNLQVKELQNSVRATGIHMHFNK